MKELTKRKHEQTEERSVQPEKKLTLVNQLRPQPGQKVWEVNMETEEVKIAERAITYAPEFFSNGKLGGVSTSSRIIMKPDTFYVCSINEKNALRKFHKALRAARRHN